MFAVIAGCDCGSEVVQYVGEVRALVLAASQGIYSICKCFARAREYPGFRGGGCWVCCAGVGRFGTPDFSSFQGGAV